MAVCPSTEVGSVPTAPVPATTCHLLLCHPLAPHRRTRPRPRANAPHLVPCSDHPARTQWPASAASGAREAPEKQKPSEKGDGWQPPEQPRHMQLVLRRTECHPRHTFCLSGDSLVTRSCCLCPRSLSGLWRDRSRKITQIATMTCKDSLAD